MDGSTVVGSQLAVAQALGCTDIANQLSKGVAGMSASTMQDESYIQRINTKGGADCSKACDDADIGDKLTTDALGQARVSSMWVDQSGNKASKYC